MGYDLRITRRKRWDRGGPAITADEWLDYVRDDPELRLEPEMGLHFAVWSPPSRPEEEWPAWLDWEEEGTIYAKNPDPALIDKMVAIARHFDATVQGEEWEIYEGGDQPPRRVPLSSRERTAMWFEDLPFRLRHWFRRLFPSRSDDEPPPFDVGDRVRERLSGDEYTVVEIDLEAEHGAGIIRYRRDDGWETRHLWFGGVGNTFTRIEEEDER